jgi:hypothetical protein
MSPLVGAALIAVDAPGEDVEAAIHDGVDRLGIETLSERPEADDIGEEDGDLLALAFAGTARRQDALGEMRWGGV